MIFGTIHNRLVVRIIVILLLFYLTRNHQAQVFMNELLDSEILFQEFGNFLVVVSSILFIEDFLQNFHKELLILPLDLILIKFNAIYWGKLSHAERDCFFLIEKSSFSYVVASISDCLIDQFGLNLEFVNENHDSLLILLQATMRLKKRCVPWVFFGQLCLFNRFRGLL